MSTILQTTSNLTRVNDDFTLLTEYSGETNPNVTFDVFFTVTDGLNALQGVNIEIGLESFITDINGQITVTLIRGLYSAALTLTGYTPNFVNFEVLDENLAENITMNSIGSFDDSYDDSYEK